MKRWAQWSAWILSVVVLSAQDRRLRPEQIAVPPAGQQARVALVIGNGAYKAAPLRNPVNDARAMAEALKGCGFQVTELENADREQMMQGLREFGGRIHGGGVGLFYFAGHGVQVKGRNYLVPVHADIATEDEVAFNSLDVDAVLAKMETAHNRLNIMILDACRDNPFGRGSRSLQQGLAQMDAPAGTYLAFATSPGHTAADGSGDHGLYTQQLLANIRTPGLVLEDLFKRVRAGVMLATGGAQVPWENSSILGDFYFVPGAAGAAPPPPLPLPQPVMTQSGIHFRPAPAPTPAEVDLMAAMHEKGLGRVLPLAKPLAAKGSLYGRFALDYMTDDPATFNQSMAAYAQAGIPLAMAQYGDFLLKHPLSTAEMAEARDWLDKAIALGEPEAMFDLGIELVEGTHFSRDLDQAERLFAQAARLNKGYYYGVGCLYWDNRTFRSAYPPAVADAKGLAFMQRGADLGEIGAMGELASAYQYGQHAPKDLRQALRWAMTAAEQDQDPYWTARVGEFYRDVDDPAYRSGPKAITWFTKAAERGYAHAYGEMAAMYEEGGLVPKDLPKAVSLYLKAAEQGDGESQDALAKLYERGTGVPRDLSQAFFWENLAGSRDPELNSQLPEPEQNRILARLAAWNRARAEKGSQWNQYKLAQAYEKGRGVPRDLSQAYFWYVLAAKDVPPSEGRAYKRDRLGRQLPAPERARIEAQAAAWKPKQ